MSAGVDVSGSELGCGGLVACGGGVAFEGVPKKDLRTIVRLPIVRFYFFVGKHFQGRDFGE